MYEHNNYSYTFNSIHNLVPITYTKDKIILDPLQILVRKTINFQSF